MTPPTPAEPASVGADDSVSRLLDDAEDIVNAVVTSTRAEVDEQNRYGGFDKSRAGGALDSVKRFFTRHRK